MFYRSTIDMWMKQAFSWNEPFSYLNSPARKQHHFFSLLIPYSCSKVHWEQSRDALACYDLFFQRITFKYCVAWNNFKRFFFTLCIKSFCCIAWKLDICLILQVEIVLICKNIAGLLPRGRFPISWWPLFYLCVCFDMLLAYAYVNVLLYDYRVFN